MSLADVFPQNRSVYFISNFPSLTLNHLNKDEDYEFASSEVKNQKTKVST